MLSVALVFPSLLHSGTPWLLRSVLRSSRGAPVRSRPTLASVVYPLVTIALGVIAALLLIGTDAWSSLPTHAGVPIQIVAGMVVGLAVALAAGAVVGRSWRLRREPAARRAAVVTGIAGAAEEAVWRLGAVAGLLAAGLPAPVVAMLVGLGFLVLHLPLYGGRRLPYLSVLTVALGLLAALIGPFACVAAHVGHNVILALTGGPRRSATSSLDAPSISSSSW